MCLAIYRPKGRKFPDEVFINGFDNNEDGAGFAFIDEVKNKLVVVKGLMTKEKFFEEFKKIGDAEAIIHFRRASPGMTINEEQTHPFYCDTADTFECLVRDADGHGVNDDKGKPLVRASFEFAVLHNGKLPWKSTNKKSDTHCYFEDILEPAFQDNPEFIGKLYAHRLIINHVGEDNKIVVMRLDVEACKSMVWILNDKEKPAHNKFGCWFSNYSYDYKRVDVSYEPPSTSIDDVLDRRWRTDGPPYTGKPYKYVASTNYHGEDWDRAMHDLPAGFYGRGKDLFGRKKYHGYKKHDFQRDAGTLPDTAPDKYGWYWSGSRHMFVNKNTDAIADTLSYRARPSWADPAPVNGCIYKDGLKPNDCGLILDAQGNILVTVRAKDEPVDKTVIKDTSTYVDPMVGLYYLDEIDKRIFKRLAFDYCQKALGHEGKRGKTIGDQIKIMREDARTVVEELSKVNNEQLDLWLINRHKHHGDVIRFLMESASKAIFKEGVLALGVIDEAKGGELIVLPDQSKK